MGPAAGTLRAPWLCDFAKATHPLCVSVSTSIQNGHGDESQPLVGEGQRDCLTVKENQYIKWTTSNSPCVTARSGVDEMVDMVQQVLSVGEGASRALGSP